MKIKVSNVETQINAVQVDLKYDPEMLEVIDISTRDSFASIFVNKEIDNSIGFARISGGLPNPGIRPSESGTVFGSVYLEGKSPGVTNVEFLPSSMVLANDGRGTNVLRELSSVSYFIVPDEVTSEEKQAQKAKLSADVLGTYDDDQILLFDENEKSGTELSLQKGESVLGSQVDLNEKGDNITKVLGFIERVDRAILVFWQDIFKNL